MTLVVVVCLGNSELENNLTLREAAYCHRRRHSHTHTNSAMTKAKQAPWCVRGMAVVVVSADVEITLVC